MLCVYRSPSLTHESSESMIKYLDNYCASQSIINKNMMIITGDFNLPDVDWDNGIVNCPANTKNKNFVMQQNFLDFFRLRGLYWTLENSMHSRCRLVKDKLQISNLDQILISDTNFLRQISLTHPLGKSDHVGIRCELNLKTNTKMLTLNKKCWGKVTTSTLLNYGKCVNWKPDHNIYNTDILFSNLCTKMEEIVNKVPISTCKVTKAGDIICREPFSTASLRKSHTKVNKMWHVYNACPTVTNYNIAREASRAHEEKTRNCVVNYEMKITREMKSNPKIFYSYLASKKQVKNTLSGLKNSKGDLMTSPVEVANELGNFFQSTFTSEPPGHIPDLQSIATENIQELNITTEHVTEVLRTVNPCKTMGPDNIHPKLLKALSENVDFINSVTSLFRSCYEMGRMPEIWKLANVVALHKKGDKLKSANYRPKQY